MAAGDSLRILKYSYDNLNLEIIDEMKAEIKNREIFFTKFFHKNFRKSAGERKFQKTSPLPLLYRLIAPSPTPVTSTYTAIVSAFQHQNMHKAIRRARSRKSAGIVYISVFGAKKAIQRKIGRKYGKKIHSLKN